MQLIEILETSQLARALPHLFPDDMTRDSIKTDRDGDVVLSRRAFAEILRWAYLNGFTARLLADRIEADNAP